MCERSELVIIFQLFCSFSQTRHLTVELCQPKPKLDWKTSKMTRQFCRKKQGKNGHIFGKIRHCGKAPFLTFIFSYSFKKVLLRRRRWRDFDYRAGHTAVCSVFHFILGDEIVPQKVSWSGRWRKELQVQNVLDMVKQLHIWAERPNFPLTKILPGFLYM